MSSPGSVFPSWKQVPSFQMPACAGFKVENERVYFGPIKAQITNGNTDASGQKKGGQRVAEGPRELSF